MTIEPPTVFVKRSNVRHNVDFPLPVRPQIPTRSLDLMEKDIFERTFAEFIVRSVVVHDGIPNNDNDERISFESDSVMVILILE